MKKQTLHTLLALMLLATTLLTACTKTKTPEPNNPVPKTITIADVAQQYFVFQKNVGKPLVVIYFVEEAGTWKFYYDGRGTRRVGVPTIADVDAAAGTATLSIDVDGDGASVIQYKLAKSGSGAISLNSTTYQGATTAVLGSNIYKVADLVNFKFNGLTFNRNFSSGGTSYQVKCEFSATMLKLYSFNASAGTAIDAFNKPYYALNNNVGAKVDPDCLLIAHKNTDGTIGYDIDDNGLVLSF